MCREAALTGFAEECETLPFALSQSSVLVDQLILAVIIHGGTWEPQQGGRLGEAAQQLQQQGRHQAGTEHPMHLRRPEREKGHCSPTPLSSFPSLSSEVATATAP